MQADGNPINALPEDPAILRALLVSAWSERDRIVVERNELAEQNERLQHLVLKLTRLKFGTKSERLPDDQLQLALGDVETAIAQAEAQGEKRDPERKREAVAKRRASRGALPADLPRVEVTLAPKDTNCPCCRAAMTEIGHDESQRLDVIPVQYRVIVTRRPKFACRACEGVVVQAPAPARLIEGGIPTEALVANVMVSRFADHQPLYRQAQIMARQGVLIDRATLAFWVGYGAAEMAPVVRRLKEIVLSSARIFADETTMKVLDPGRGRTKQGYFWVAARDDRACGGADPSAVIYQYATGRAKRHADALLGGYARLCRLLSLGKKRGGKAQCLLDWSDLVAYSEGLIAILIPDEADDTCALRLRRLSEVFGNRAYMALTLRRRPNDQLRLCELSNMAKQARVPTVVTNDVLFHDPLRRILQDVVTCIRHGCTIDDAGFRRERHADRYLKPPAEMHRLFSRYPEALARTAEIANRCRFSLDELSYQYPEELLLPGLTAQEALAQLTWEGAKQRYPDGVPNEVIATLKHELKLIATQEYAPYFLTVNSIVRFARSQGILCQGRGSAANSAVCYVLGVTSIDPARNDLLFERFVSEERREPPDIDVDFEHERREIVMQWVFDTYGRDHAALCAVVIRYRTRGALRDVGKALGLPEDLITLLNSQVSSWSEEGIDPEQAAELNLNLGDRRLKLAIDLARQLIGTPRHLSQHPGGFVLTRDRLDELVPIEPAAMDNRQVIEWDKDDIDALKFMKVDCLALGMLSCMKRGFDLLAQHKGITLDLASIPAEDPRTYAMISRADTVGTFQIESRAQMSMLPRMKPRTFYDLVIEVAIVRPGPIQGDMVHPYLRRREGKEKVEYPTPQLEKVLGKTLGVPLFQEQAMRVAIECAGFTAGEADQLRRAMATFKHTGSVTNFQEKLITGMVANGYTQDFAERIFKQLEGFGSYGFPESHAASFALIAYASSWMKCHHPDVFCAALLNAQPMGFYAPAQIVRDASNHGVEIRPACINASRWDCTLEPTVNEDRFAVRLGLRMIKGLSSAHAATLIGARADEPFASVDDIWRRAAIPAASLVQIAEADAFLHSLNLARREALWAIKALRDEPLPLFAAAANRAAELVPECAEPSIALQPMKVGSEVVEDYRHLGLSLRAHPLSFLRNDLRHQKIVTCAEAMQAPDNKWLEAAGIVLVRQKPGSAKGVMFITLEDETGIANLVIWPDLYEKQRRVIVSAGMISAYGRIQREGGVVHLVVHLVAHRLTDLSGALRSIAERDVPASVSRGHDDQTTHGRGFAPQETLSHNPRDDYILDHDADRIKVKTRDFR